MPTPVGPINKKLPIGLFASAMPALARRIARAIALTASSWLTTLLCRIFSKFNNFSFSA
ncbi:MAG: hypothetical protein ABIG90_03195 [bacterium]